VRHYDGRELHQTLCEALEFPVRDTSARLVRQWLVDELGASVPHRLYARATRAKADLVRDLGLAVTWCAAAGIDVHIHCERGLTFVVHYDSGLTEILRPGYGPR
jgi:hypothetical protein